MAITNKIALAHSSPEEALVPSTLTFSPIFDMIFIEKNNTTSGENGCYFGSEGLSSEFFCDSSGQLELLHLELLPFHAVQVASNRRLELAFRLSLEATVQGHFCISSSCKMSTQATQVWLSDPFGYAFVFFTPVEDIFTLSILDFQKAMSKYLSEQVIVQLSPGILVAVDAEFRRIQMICMENICQNISFAETIYRAADIDEGLLTLFGSLYTNYQREAADTRLEFLLRKGLKNEFAAPLDMAFAEHLKLLLESMKKSLSYDRSLDK